MTKPPMKFDNPKLRSTSQSFSSPKIELVLIEQQKTIIGYRKFCSALLNPKAFVDHPYPRKYNPGIGQ